MTKRRRYDEGEMARGRLHEMEHVDDPSFAEIIASDHLREDEHYYSHLESCMPGERRGCQSCKPNPGFVKTAADERLWKRAKEAAGRTYRVGSDSYWRVANVVFHKMKAAHTNPRLPYDWDWQPEPETIRNTLHDIVDEMMNAPQHMSMRDYSALRRIANDAGVEVVRALLEFHLDPEGFDHRDFIWLMQNLHEQIDYASNAQVMEYMA